MDPYFPILLIADDANDLMMARRAFREAGLANPLRVAKSDHQAIAYLRGDGKFSDRNRHPLPLLVMIDFEMPLRTGLEAFRWMRAQKEFKEIPAIILTASFVTTDGNIQRANELGVTAHLTKPLNYKHWQQAYRIVVQYWNEVLPKRRPVLFGGHQYWSKYSDVPVTRQKLALGNISHLMKSPIGRKQSMPGSTPGNNSC
ncbi:MAG: response regulator with CheY-like receiver domain and winged-helix DNA-binding domain [Pedosphaera sp.]|nr:response regulator with CheY-like receiver domain and winged-helix DNA-binding domain [Pedosphaera sp.]